MVFGIKTLREDSLSPVSYGVERCWIGIYFLACPTDACQHLEFFVKFLKLSDPVASSPVIFCQDVYKLI